MEKSIQTGAAFGQNAIALLTADHDTVKKLFKQFEKMKDGDKDEKAELVRRVCAELTVHAQIEEEIFNPAIRETIDDDDLLDEAEVEHASAKDLIRQLEIMDPNDALFDAKVTVLGEYINHHVEEEQGQMFPKAKKAKIDLIALGAELYQRKQELMAGVAMAEAEMHSEDENQTPRLKRKTASGQN